MTTCSVFYLIVLVDAIINDVNEPAITALFKVAATLRWHPLAGLYLVVRLALLRHGSALREIEPSCRPTS